MVVGTTTPAVCTATNGKVSFTRPGDCVITADQAGDATHAAAPRVTQTVAVGKTAQSISLTTTPPAAPTTGVAYPLAATATSELPVTFGATGPCTITSTGRGTGTVTLTGAGACTATASQSGDATRLAATPVTQTYQAAAATSQAELRISVMPGSEIRQAGPQSVTVSNTGSRDSGATSTQLLTTMPVTDAGGAVRTGGVFGTSVLTGRRRTWLRGRRSPTRWPSTPAPGSVCSGRSPGGRRRTRTR